MFVLDANFWSLQAETLRCRHTFQLSVYSEQTLFFAFRDQRVLGKKTF